MGKQFTPKQDKVLLDLLKGLSIASVAKTNKVAEQTIYNWLNDQTFRANYRKLKREIFEQSISKIQSQADKAISTLDKNLGCGNPSAEIRAAQIILDYSVRAIETMDILERLENLENEHQEQTK